MKVLIEAYNTYRQTSAGGVQTRISNLLSNFKKIDNKEVLVEQFDKWNSKVENHDIIHFFKASIDHYNLMMYSKSKGLKIVLSSITPIEGKLKISILLFIARYLRIYSIHYLIKRNFELADSILAQTDKEKEFISDTYNIRKAKISVIPNGVSDVLLNGVKGDFRQKYNLVGDFVLMVGRVDSNKNQLSVIKALKGTGVQLVIIGGKDPEDRTNYMQQCIDTSDENVKFIGWLDAKDPLLASAYLDCKVVVLASLKEIYGNCIYEGLANYSYVAYTNVLDITDNHLKDYIRCFNPRSVKEIKENVLSLISKEEVKSGGEYVRNNFSWYSIADKHIEIYKELNK